MYALCDFVIYLASQPWWKCLYNTPPQNVLGVTETVNELNESRVITYRSW